MSKIKKTSCILLIVVFIFSIKWTFNPNNQQVNSSNQNEKKQNVCLIKLEISIEKTSFLEGESIWLTVKFKNMGTKKDSLKNLNEHEILSSIILKDNSGKVANFKGLSTYLLRDRYYLLQPNESVEFNLELTYSYGTEKEKLPENKVAFAKPYFFPPGNYNVKIEVSDEDRNLEISSNEIVFSVKEPENIDFEALTELRKIYGMYDVTDNEKEQKIQAYKTFLEKYSKSRYFEQTFNQWVVTKGLSGVAYSIDIADDIMEFLNQSPNSMYTHSLMWYLADVTTKFAGGKGKAIELLKTLKKDYPNTRINSAASKILKSDRFGEEE